MLRIYNILKVIWSKGQYSVKLQSVWLSLSYPTQVLNKDVSCLLCYLTFLLTIFQSVSKKEKNVLLLVLDVC